MLGGRPRNASSRASDSTSTPSRRATISATAHACDCMLRSPVARPLSDGQAAAARRPSGSGVGRRPALWCCVYGRGHWGPRVRRERGGALDACGGCRRAWPSALAEVERSRRGVTVTGRASVTAGVLKATPDIGDDAARPGGTADTSARIASGTPASATTRPGCPRRRRTTPERARRPRPTEWRGARQRGRREGGAASWRQYSHHPHRGHQGPAQLTPKALE